jgi:hypothetical protein
MFAFPLVGLALAAMFRGRRDPLAAVAVLAAFVYATAYTALDVINGIGAGYVTWRLDPAAPRPDEVRSLFDIGSPLGQVGSWALVLAAVLVCADALTRDRVLALPGLLLVPGAFLVHTDHIFWPLGVLGITLVGLGTGWLRGVYTPENGGKKYMSGLEFLGYVVGLVQIYCQRGTPCCQSHRPP